MQIKAVEFRNADEAIQETEASGYGEAIRVAGQFLVVEQAEAERLEAAGVEFSYLHNHLLPDGSSRLVTVPVN